MKCAGKTCLISLFLAGGMAASQAGTPTLAQLSSYDVVLAYSDFTPSDPVALGNVLADYVDLGGNVVVATYGFTSPWAIAGRIMTPGYSPLVNLGSVGDVSGDLVPVNPADPIFSGVNLAAFTYFHNLNFAHAALDTGAELLATDGAGINMIARNSAGSVIGLNFFPAGDDFNGNNSEFYKLLNNSLTSFDPLADSLLIVAADTLPTAKDELLALGNFSRINEFIALPGPPAVPDSGSTAVLLGVVLSAFAGFRLQQRA